jgi:nicotinate-nucleotide adenylyltransferase
MMATTKPIILFGGTFDPPHRAHVELPLLAANLIGADTVCFIPAGLNPQKSEHPPTESHHRVAMLEAAIAGEPRATISRIEVDRSGPSYMIDTVEAIHADLGPDAPTVRLLIGADQALNFRTWKRWEDLEALAEPLVMPRAPHTIESLPADLEASHPGAGAIWMKRVVDIPPIEVDSTGIRKAVADGSSLERFVQPPVARYILENGLYGPEHEQGRLNT